MESVRDTANDRFKQSFNNWFWGSVAVAALLHFGVFALFPTLQAEDVRSEESSLTAVDLPPEIEIPPPPQAIARPATPVVSDVVMDEDITIASTTFESNPVENLPPPPSASGASADDLAKAPTFTPMTVRPELRNSGDVQRALVRNYPPLLRDAGIGGQATVWFFIDENGRVIKTQLSKPSGYTALDEAALDVAKIMQFSPAYNRDKKVPVWVEIPIVFTAK
ncbi:MAG TPA: energy transducer TonB [Longimicrobiales bacterium]|nr:energy transducer TonB [Longimicrobiales bacterium]